MKNEGGPEGRDTSLEQSRYHAEREREYMRPSRGSRTKAGNSGGGNREPGMVKRTHYCSQGGPFPAGGLDDLVFTGAAVAGSCGGRLRRSMVCCAAVFSWRRKRMTFSSSETRAAALSAVCFCSDSAAASR